jgi:uncharacterized SAM-dependent methyltransferase
MKCHASAHPARLAEVQARSFTQGRLEPALHYAGPRQALRWQAVHRAHAPAGRGVGLEPYVEAMQAAGQGAGSRGWWVALGCGGGGKEAAALAKMEPAGLVAVDVSPTLVWSAQEAWRAVRPELEVRGLVADLEAASAWVPGLEAWTGAAPRVVTFFGVLPNMEPERAQAALSPLVREEDFLVLGANLAPGADGPSGAARVLGQYANAETEHWLAAAMEDADVPRATWEVEWEVAEAGGWARIRAWARFTRPATAQWEGGMRRFAAGERVELFFSNRPTAAQVRAWLEAGGWEVVSEWLATNGEEGTWLARRKRF